MDVDKIKELVRLMVDNDLAEISLRDGTEEVNLKRPGVNASPTAPPVVDATPLAPAIPSVPPAPGPAEAPPPEEPAPAADEGLVPIRSPMVGTYYSSPDPDSPPFVQAGTQVTPETVVCIVEAMKVFNEIKAELSGTVVKVLVKNEDAVEYGQELYLVRP